MSIQENKQHNMLHIGIIGLLVITISIGIMNMKTIKDIEVMKVWWIENYEKLQKIMNSSAYKDNYAKNLDLMLTQIEWGKDILSDEENTSPSQDVPTWTTGNDVIIRTGDSTNPTDQNLSQGDE